mgnify:CR=1 FL=1
MENLYDDLEEMTPENIAEILFSKMPDDPLTKQLLIKPSSKQITLYKIVLSLMIQIKYKIILKKPIIKHSKTT